jgi:hypothetical protein
MKIISPYFLPVASTARCFISHITNKSGYNTLCKKSKAIPLQAWTGPEGSRRLRLPDFKTIGT